jgi:hypothetical protein
VPSSQRTVTPPRCASTSAPALPLLASPGRYIITAAKPRLHRRGRCSGAVPVRPCLVLVRTVASNDIPAPRRCRRHHPRTPGLRDPDPLVSPSMPVHTSPLPAGQPATARGDPSLSRWTTSVETGRSGAAIPYASRGSGRRASAPSAPACRSRQLSLPRRTRGIAAQRCGGLPPPRTGPPRSPPSYVRGCTRDAGRNAPHQPWHVPCTRNPCNFGTHAAPAAPPPQHATRGAIRSRERRVGRL